MNMDIANSGAETTQPRKIEWRAEEEVMKWYGWGSAVGMSILLLAVGATALMLRHAIYG
ncbi:hypothetical protein [Terrarubrum flagellatum]|uniref:hypothetical protein n=1 Tax=Terrirubrum flagellatum TaxID=2895980 RepID=UPI003144D6E2